MFIPCSHREARNSCGNVVAGTIDADEHIYEDPEDIKHFDILTASSIPSPHDIGGNEGAAASSNVHPQMKATKSDSSMSKNQQLNSDKAGMRYISPFPDFKQAVSFEMSAPKPSLPPVSETSAEMREMAEMQKQEEDVPPSPVITTASNGEKNLSSNSSPQTESRYQNVTQAMQFLSTKAKGTEEEEYIVMSPIPTHATLMHTQAKSRNKLQRTATL